MIRLDTLVLMGSFILALLPASAGATDFAVTRTDDPAPNGCLPADCSLREAVLVANALPGTDRIVLPAGLYQLTIAGTAADDAAVGDLDIDDNVEVLGAGADTTTILVVNNNRIFSASGHSLTLKKVTLAGGRADNGGAILTGGPLIVEDSILSGNQVTGSGGAIFGGASQIVLRRAQLSNNTAATAGGAVYGGTGGVLVVDSTINDNVASSLDGGGIASLGPTRVYRSVFESNHAAFGGGGISCFAGLEVRESTLSGNHSDDTGGGIYSSYPLLIDRSALSGNTAASSGGALAVSDYGGGERPSVVSSTLYLNTAPSGSAIYFFDPYPEWPEPELLNTVISGTCATSGSRNFVAIFGNVESPGNTCNLGANSSHDVAAVNLKLGTLGDNGGPTPTHLPLAGSAVLGAGENCASYDQRGYGLTSIAVCDSGSVSASAVDDAVFRYGFDF